MVEIGDAITYVDQFAKPHNALVTAVWKQSYFTGVDNSHQPGLNLVYVSDNESEHDQYGRQIRREATSVVHKDNQPAHGRYWQ